MPEKKSLLDHAHKLMRERKESVTVAIAVQDGNYIGKTNDDSPAQKSWPNLVPSLFAFASAELGAKYIFWGAQEPYFAQDVVPYSVRTAPVINLTN